MKALLFVLLSMCLTTFAQENQCPVAGQIIKRELLKVSGDEVKKPFFRAGNSAISNGGALRGEITTKTFNEFSETFCRADEVQYSEEVCQNVPLNIALGHGNETLRSIFDLSLSPLTRAEIFAKVVTFFTEAPSSERLSFSRQIVIALGRQAASTGIPESWEKLESMLKSIVAAGEIPQSLLDQITVVNLQKNKKALGFYPLEGVKISEGKGNGKIQKFFDLELSINTRAELIKESLVGLEAATTSKVAISFIEFAASNGIPTNWDQFVLLMKASQESGAISISEMTTVLVTAESQNRKSLGFDLSAKSCKLEPRTRLVNVIDKRNTKDFLRDVTKTFDIELTRAPLLPGEREDYNVVFDGVSKLGLSYTSRFNSYVTTSYEEKNDAITMKVLGTRKLVTPRNNVVATVKRDGNSLNISLQNKDFIPSLAGKVIVKIDVYEEITFWPDQHLATKTFELTTGDLTEFANQVKLRNPGRKIRLDVSIQITGTSYYTNDFSDVVEMKGL